MRRENRRGDERRGAQVEVSLPGGERRSLVLAPGPIKSLLAYRVRGYRVGKVELGGATRRVALVDEDLDGEYASGNDALLLDREGAGRLTREDVLPPRGMVTVGAVRYAMLARADGRAARFVERPTGMGTVRLLLPEKVTAEQCAVSLRFETGAAQQITAPNRPVTVPAGLYYVAAASFAARAGGGETWEYSLTGNRDVPTLDGDPQRLISVDPGQEVPLDLFSKPRMTLTADATQVVPGGRLMVNLEPQVGYGPRLVADGSAQATMVTRGPTGEQVDQGSAGFG